MVRGPADEVAVARGCVFDPESADHATRFFEGFLRHTTGHWAGRPFLLQPWQRDHIIRPLFGWRRPNGTRRFNTAYIEIPKKNGKSSLAAGVVLYLTCADGEPRAEVYSAAADRNQAGIVFREAANFVRASPALTPRLEVVPSQKVIVDHDSGSFYKVLSADAYRQDGINAHGIIFDELHTQRNRDLFDALRYAGASRRQPLLVSITTAGYDRGSICWEQHDYAEKVLTGVLEDDSFLAYITAAAEDDDWTDPRVWQKANPSLGVTISVDSMAKACQEAQNSPAKQNAFKRYRLNIWTTQDVRWFDLSRWDVGGAPFDEAELDGRECFVGLDLATTTDIAAAVFVFPVDGVYRLVCRFWVPEISAREKLEKKNVNYPLWVQQGLIKATEGDVIDYETILADLLALGDRFRIQEFAVDPWNATQIAQKLQDEDFQVAMFRQGFASMSGPSKEFERLVLEGRLHHGGNPVLRWMASNVAIEQDAAGNIKPSKKRSTEKIDGIVATVMGLGRAIVKPEMRSVYDDRGIEFL